MQQYLFYFFFTLFLVFGCSQSKGGYYAQYAPGHTINQPLPLDPLSAGHPRGRMARREAPKPAKGVVVLDPGHGGDDYGTHSLGTPKFHEKYLNLSTARQVQTYLQQFGHTVIMTRSDDTFIALDKRAAFANARKPNLFVSIHYNSAPSTDAEGIEVFYFRTDGNKERVNQSKQLAQSILEKTIQSTRAKSRGVKHGNYAVLRETEMPAALIEGGFLTNQGEMEKIKDASYMKKVALGIAQGIDSYLAKTTILTKGQ